MTKNKIRVKVRFLILLLILACGIIKIPTNVNAKKCPDVKFVFARGSGGTRWEDQNYLEYKRTIEEKMAAIGLSYDFLDLDYPAVGVGIDNLSVTAGAFFGAGDAYEFGESVNSGVKELIRVVNNECKETKYVLGGYSQGAMVISKALTDLNADKIIYAATFGDPKIYLPEGKGLVPVACSGKNLSDYRVYVPDCRAYEGLLGSYRPYQPEKFIGKFGTWCNKFDIFCSSYFSMNDHTSYVSDNLYEDASRMIAHKVTKEFELKNKYTSPHDTVILIDSTGSMAGMIDHFKEEALRLATETFDAGGRVALYDYRDIGDPYDPVARCDFNTCTKDYFSDYLDEIVTDGGGDIPESLLSASVGVMHELKWRRGATKSLVVLTDAPFLSPDRDATTVEDVTELSKRIDPVNMYIITDETVVKEQPEMVALAEATGGKVVTDMGELNLLTDYIMKRYDSLPKVEEEYGGDNLPTLEIVEVIDSGENVSIKYSGSDSALVILNEAVLGIANGGVVNLKDLNRDILNNVVLVPINNNRRGEGVKVVIEAKVLSNTPRVPDTGIIH